VTKIVQLNVCAVVSDSRADRWIEGKLCNFLAVQNIGGMKHGQIKSETF